MEIYICTLCLILVLWILLRSMSLTGARNTRIYDQNKKYITCIGIWLFLIEMLRNYTVGADTYTYLWLYKMFVNAEWKDVFQLADRFMFEHGFAVFNKLLGYISSNPRFFLIVSSFIIIFLYSWCIYKNSTMSWLSFYMFMTLGLFNDSMNTTRQSMAVVLSLLACKYIKQNKLYKFIALILLASTIHKSVLIVLPMFWISKLKFNKKNICRILSLSLIVLLMIFKFFDPIFCFVSKYIGTYERYDISISSKFANGAVGLTVIFILFLILIVMEQYKKADESRNIYVVFAIASVILALLTFKISIAERIIPYFSAMFLFSVPKSITNIKSKIIRAEYVSIICLVLILYYFLIICRANVTQFFPYELWGNAMNRFGRIY